MSAAAPVTSSLKSISMATSASSSPSTPTSAPQSPTRTSSTPTVTSPSTSPAATTTNAASSNPATSSSSTAASSSGASAQSSSAAPSTSSSAFVTQVTQSGGTVETITSTAFVVPTVTSGSQNNNSSSKSFFSNTGAVAGVFTVVGLIALGLVIALIINAIRRHRAKQFDKDVAEAAAEAAAMSRSPFDDYSYGNSGGNSGGGGYGYSGDSHGAYQLPPLPPQNEAYGMSEMSRYDPYAAGAASLAAPPVGRSRGRKDSEPGAPGIAGVGAGTLAREPSKRAPYHAFAGPGAQPHDLQPSHGTFRSQRSNQGVLEAAGLAGAGGAAAIMANNNFGNSVEGAYVTRQPSDAAQTTLSKFGSMSSGGHHPQTLQPGYPVDSYYPHRNDSLSPDPFAGYPPVAPAPAPSQPLPNPHDATTPSPSPPGRQSDHHEDSESASPTALRSDERRMSYQDDTDYSQGHRVLRVANE